MKVKCIIDEYFDRKLDKYVKKDEVFSTDIQRAKVLIKKKFVKEVKSNAKLEDVRE